MRFTTVAGVITCNEEATIGPLLEALRAPHDGCEIVQIIVVSAECRDRTDEIVRAAARKDPRIHLITEPRRRGKSAAVNTFLAARLPGDLTLLTSGDVLPEPDAIARIVAAFRQSGTGMAGGRPVPVNPGDNLLGRMASLMWQWHHDIAVRHPKLGELVIFRSDLASSIPADSPVDEASLEAAILATGAALQYVPGAVIHNRGPDTLTEWISQRRRIAHGHQWLRRTGKHHVSTGNNADVLGLFWRCAIQTPGRLPEAVALIICEIIARILSLWDGLTGRNHAVWEIAPSTKTLEPRQEPPAYRNRETPTARESRP